jgi:hypothetical protein
MLLALSFLLYLPSAISGFWLAHRLWRESTPQALWFKLFLGLPLGLGLWSLGYFLWIWVGLNKTIFPWLELAVSIVLTILVIPSLKLLFAPLNLRSLRSPFYLVFLLVMFATAVLFGLQLYMSPHGHEDAWFIWNLNARFIYLAQDWRIIYAPNGPGWHPDYPLLVSLNTVFGWVILGQDTPRIQMAVTALFTLVLPGILFSGLSLIKDKKQAVLATIVLLASPTVINYGVSQQADIPLAGYVLTSLVLAALYFKIQNSKLLLLAGLTIALTAWAKNEGFLFILINFVLMSAFLIVLRQSQALKEYAIGIAIPFLVILLFKLTQPVSNDLFEQNTLPQLLDGERYRLILFTFFGTIAKLGRWTPFSLAAILVVYGLLVWFDYSESLIVKYIGLTLLLQMFGYFVIYLLTPHDLAWHLKTSLERLLVQIFPTALFLFFYATKSPDFNLPEGQ